MTIDEVIENLKYDVEIDMYIRDIAPQLADWLKELKAYRGQHQALCDIYDVNTVEDIYNKGLDRAIKAIDDNITYYHNYEHENISVGDVKNAFIDLKDYVEQLKDGENDPEPIKSQFNGMYIDRSRV